MDPAHRLFVAACELGAAERSALLDAECAGQPQLRAAVLELLRHFDQSPSFLRAPEAAPEPRLPEQIGPYRILGELGRGGMGVVYRAEQPHPRRAVALKLLHHAMASETTRRRFAHEIETLGRLRHTGIAQIFAAGFWDVGTLSQPYFAMELVDGTALTTFARSHALPVAARVELVCQVCDAVQHAHENGVIHRDLKPANVLVTGGGAAPAQVKILDFGIARSLGAAGDTALLTRSGEVLGTLAYMSPEQIAGHSDEVSARSDVYMLGVLLYELLTGRLPLDVDGCTLTRAAQVVCDQEPPRLGRLDPALRGDLEVIAATALCKEAERRYASAQALGDDLRRFLRQEPIQARPQTALYQLRKFTRRNRALVGGVAATMLMLLFGLIGVTVLAHRLAQAQQRAEHGAEELRATLYHSQMRLAGGAITAHGGLASVRDLLAEWLPAPGQQDLRGWEWRWLDALANAHAVGLAPDDNYRWVGWSAAATLLTLGGRGVVRLDPTTGQELGVVLGGPTTSHAETTADGRRLVTCSDAVVSVHDLTSGAELCRWPTRLPNPSLRVDPSGRLCAVHQSGGGSTPARIEWCQLATGAMVHAIAATRPGALAAAMAFSADGARFAYYADDHTVRVADTSSGQIVASLAQIAGASALAFAPDQDHLAIASFDGRTYLWQLRTGAHRVLAGHRHQITCVAFSGDSATLATAGAEGDIRLWSVAQGTGRLLGAHHLGVQGLAFSPDHQRLVTVGRNELRIWPTDRLAAWRPLSGGDQWSHAEVTVGAGSDGSQVAGGAVQLPQGGAGQLVHVRNGHTGAVLDAVPGVNLDQSRDGRWLAFFHDHQVQVRAPGDPNVRAALALPGIDVLHDLKWRPSGDALALSHAHGVTVWRPGTAAALHQASPFQPTHLAWHPAGERLAAVQFGVTELLLLEVHADRLTTLAPVTVTPRPVALEWSAAGDRAAVGRTDGVVEIRDGDLKTVLHRVQAHTQEAVALAWSPDGTRLATGGRDQCLRLFDTQSWHEVLMVPHPRDVSSLSWSADGKCLVSACPWGHVQVFDAGVRQAARPATATAR